MRPKPTGKRAPVGVALMAKDAAATLGVCLDTLRPYVQQIVVGVDETTTDATAKVARRHGADVVFPLKVSDWHECEQHGRVLAQHFARARNETFARLDRTNLDWLMWIDSDDVLDGGEHLADLCAGVPAQAVGVWLPYWYGTVNNGQGVTTLFDRERILRASLAWEWQYRVHEVVAPVDVPSPVWTTDQRVRVRHQEGVHKTVASTHRNQLLLEIDLEELGENQRTTFYLANGYFAAGQLEEAVHWYERTTEITTNPFESWQSYCYASIAYRRLGDLDNATKAAFCAIDLIPQYKEPYWRLADVYLDAGQFDKVLYWDAEARRREDPPRFVFRNPLDATYNSRMAVADALAGKAEIRQALAVLEEAYAAVPNDAVAQRIADYRKLVAAQEQADAFVKLARGRDDDAVIALWEHAKLPDEVRAFGRVRDLVMPCYLRRRQGEAA